jgi:hypothetical protein
MANIDQVVDVSISRNTLIVDTANFNTVLFMTDEEVFAERSRKYHSLDQLLADGFLETGHAYRAAKAFFSQSPRPSQITIGNQETGESFTQAIAAQVAYDNDWYVMTSYSHLEADVLEIASVIETMNKLYAFSTQAPESLVALAEPAADDDVLGKVYELNYDRTFGIYNGDADNAFIEVAVCGKKLYNTVAGGTTWNFTVLSGQTVDSLSVSEGDIIRAKNGNTYEEISGINMIRQGTVASGEYIDVMRGSDELQSRIQTEVFRALVVTANGGSKIALTDQGVAQLIAIVEGEIKRSIENGFIKEFIEYKDDSGAIKVIDGYAIEADLVSSLTANQRASRQAPDIKFTAVIAGAIHKVAVRGVLSV